jgi:hypothetical protein
MYLSVGKKYAHIFSVSIRMYLFVHFAVRGFGSCHCFGVARHVWQWQVPKAWWRESF